MTESSVPSALPLPPVRLLGRALVAVPPPLISPLLGVAAMALRLRHRGVFERLLPLAGSGLVIDPVDLPLAILVRFDHRGAPRPIALRDAREAGPARATVRGPFAVLLDLLEGRLDGDAAFFTRDLVIEGDTEAVLMVRNAVDSDEIDLVRDLLSLLGPLAGPTERALGTAQAIMARAARAASGAARRPDAEAGP